MEVFKDIYKNAVDNRIFNNLKQQLNEMIDDEKSLISIDEFRKMFFTYFKSESKAQTNVMFEKLLPYVSVLNIGDNIYNVVNEIREEDKVAEPEKMVSIQKLSTFIDSFNFAAVKVNKIRSKNASNEMTYVMTSNTKSDLANKDTMPAWQDKSDEEKRLIKLLSLVSYKLYERFGTLREAFRYIDTDHSQSISINEFAQAIDFFRLKISFADVKKLFLYMDATNDGSIGYEEFTLLSEERWRNIDPFIRYNEGVNSRDQMVKTPSSEKQSSLAMLHKNETSRLGLSVNDTQGYQKLEDLARNHVKIPFKPIDRESGFSNINRSDAKGYLAQSFELNVHGRPTEPSNKISNVLRHDYLRKSMVDRIERKSLLNQYRSNESKKLKERRLMPTKTQALRSQSVLDNLQAAQQHSQHMGNLSNYSQSQSQLARAGASKLSGAASGSQRRFKPHQLDADSRSGDFIIDLAPASRRMKPLPPIEQYNIYSNNYTTNPGMVQQTLPTKKPDSNRPSKNITLGQHESEMLLKDSLAKRNKRSERNAMVNEIFASKKSMNRDASHSSGIKLAK